MTKLLVIGGAGFIGSHVVEALLARGSQVAVVDDFSTGRREFLPQSLQSTTFTCDLRDRDALAELCRREGPEVVVHLAAIHHIPTCENEPHLALRVNVEGTQNVADACVKAGVRRLVFASSGAVYDWHAGPLDESVTIRPVDVYGISKVAGEQLLTRAQRMSLPELVIARLFNTVGPRETNRHLIPDLFVQLAQGQRTLRLGNTAPRRDFVHVRDVGRALACLALGPMQNGLEIFNVGSGTDYSVSELVELFARVIGEPIEIIEDPSLKRRVDRLEQLADIAKLRSLIGPFPEWNLEQALHEVWAERNGGKQLADTIPK